MPAARLDEHLPPAPPPHPRTADAWHARLVRYYAFFGFEPVVYVGNRGFFADLPHMLVWGGEGLRMDANVETMLRRWTPAVRGAARRARSSRPMPSSVGPD